MGVFNFRGAGERDRGDIGLNSRSGDQRSVHHPQATEALSGAEGRHLARSRLQKQCTRCAVKSISPYEIGDDRTWLGEVYFADTILLLDRPAVAQMVRRGHLC